MKKKFALFAAVIMLFTLISCGEPEKNTVEGHYLSESVSLNGEESDLLKYSLSVNTDETFSMIINEDDTTTGTWELKEDTLFLYKENNDGTTTLFSTLDWYDAVNKLIFTDDSLSITFKKEE